jgi:glycine hydroxymethyltransferase
MSYLVREKERKSVIVRFRFDEQHIYMPHHGDPAVNANGERFLTGQAYLENEYTAEGTPISSY